MSHSELPFDHIGEFRLDRLIQSGPFTISVLGRQPSLQRPVFIKLLRPQSEQHQQWLERFRREARISARLKHPNIVDVYTLGEAEGYAYMAMAYVDGLSLRQLIEGHGALTAAQSSHILEQIVPALQMSHEQGIVHRDIKPGNLLIDRQGLVRLTDFGLAHLGQDVAMTQQGAILGTPAYMAPEQITGEKLSEATDIFSLGATFYELLTGIKAFDGETYSACMQKILHEEPPPPSSLNPGLPEAVDELVADMLKKEAAERPGTAEVLERLRAIQKIDPAKAKAEMSEIVVSLMPDEQQKIADEPVAAGEQKRNKSRPFFIGLPILLVVIVALILLVIKPFGGGEPEVAEQQEMSNPLANKDTLLVLTEPESMREDSVSESIPQDVPQSVASQKPKTEPVETAQDTIKTAAQSAKTIEPIAPAQVALTIEPWANVLLDGQPVDSMMTLLQRELEPGEHEIVLTHPEFAPYVMNLEVAAGEQKNLNFSFLQQAGFLNIQVRPWAQVYLDGKFIDNTPLSRVLVCPAGERLLELRNPNFETFRQVLNVTRGDTLTIFHVMK